MSNTSRYSVVARASAAGILFPTCIVAGYLLGKWLGGALGTGLWPAFAGGALGAMAGFWNLYRLLTGLEDGGRTAVIEAEDRVLHRIRTRSMGFAAIGAVAALFFDWRAAVSLTIAAAVVIFSFLVLEKLTERLVPPQEKKGFGTVLPLLLVTGAGAAALGIALLRWRGFEPVAGMAGLSVVVLAIGAELLNREKGRSV